MSPWLEKGCREMGIMLPRQSLDRLAWYCRELTRWNRKFNLIARAGEKEIVERHFLDSLAVLPVIEGLEEERMLDLGSGAGFPGLVLKIVLPSLEVLLVEAKQKKAVFLDHIIRNLQLKNVKTVAARLVSTPDSEMINTYPLIISRAFASISGFLGLVREYSPPEGKVICMKGPRAEQEIREWEQTQPDSPFSIRSIHNYHLPFSGAERSLVIFGKSPSQLSDLRKLL